MAAPRRGRPLRGTTTGREVFVRRVSRHHPDEVSDTEHPSPEADPALVTLLVTMPS